MANITPADFFRMYVKPSLKGRVIFRKRNTNIRGQTLLYTKWIKNCTTGRNVAPAHLAKVRCKQEKKKDCGINDLRPYLHLYMSAYRRYFEQNVLPNNDLTRCPSEAEIESIVNSMTG